MAVKYFAMLASCHISPYIYITEDSTLQTDLHIVGNVVA